MIKISKHNIHHITNEAKLHLLDDMFDVYKHDLITILDDSFNFKSLGTDE